MNRYEAIENMGAVVKVHTLQRGIYAGQLIDMRARPGKPWRGRVRVHSVIKYPYVFTLDQMGREYYHAPLSYLNVIEAGSSSIKKYDKPLKDYIASLEEALDDMLEFIETRSGEDRWKTESLIVLYRHKIALMKGDPIVTPLPSSSRYNDLFLWEKVTIGPDHPTIPESCACATFENQGELVHAP